jgi:hypothetical protein
MIRIIKIDQKCELRIRIEIGRAQDQNNQKKRRRMMLNEGRGGMEVFGLERNSSRSNDRGVIATFGKNGR